MNSEPATPVSQLSRDSLTFVNVRDVGLAVAPMETETIDGLLTDNYLQRHDVRREVAELYKEAFLFINSAIHAAQKRRACSRWTRVSTSLSRS